MFILILSFLQQASDFFTADILDDSKGDKPGTGST
jgi:hypothetical protein